MTARVIIFVFISVISSPLQQSIGSVRTYQLGVATWPLSVVFFPVLNLMARSETYGDNSPLFWLVFFVFELCWGSGSLVWRKSMSSYMVMVNLKSPPDSIFTGHSREHIARLHCASYRLSK